jgi:hypothetical protein
MDLLSACIRLCYERPEYRATLLPLIAKYSKTSPFLKEGRDKEKRELEKQRRKEEKKEKGKTPSYLLDPDFLGYLEENYSTESWENPVTGQMNSLTTLIGKAKDEGVPQKEREWAIKELSAEYKAYSADMDLEEAEAEAQEREGQGARTQAGQKTIAERKARNKEVVKQLRGLLKSTNLKEDEEKAEEFMDTVRDSFHYGSFTDRSTRWKRLADNTLWVADEKIADLRKAAAKISGATASMAKLARGLQEFELKKKELIDRGWGPESREYQDNQQEIDKRLKELDALTGTYKTDMMALVEGIAVGEMAQAAEGITQIFAEQAANSLAVTALGKGALAAGGAKAAVAVLMARVVAESLYMTVRQELNLGDWAQDSIGKALLLPFQAGSEYLTGVLRGISKEEYAKLSPQEQKDYDKTRGKVVGVSTAILGGVSRVAEAVLLSGITPAEVNQRYRDEVEDLSGRLSKQYELWGVDEVVKTTKRGPVVVESKVKVDHSQRAEIIGGLLQEAQGVYVKYRREGHQQILNSLNGYSEAALMAQGGDTSPLRAIIDNLKETYKREGSDDPGEVSQGDTFIQSLESISLLIAQGQKQTSLFHHLMEADAGTVKTFAKKLFGLKLGSENRVFYDLIRYSIYKQASGDLDEQEDNPLTGHALLNLRRELAERYVTLKAQEGLIKKSPEMVSKAIEYFKSKPDSDIEEMADKLQVQDESELEEIPTEEIDKAPAKEAPNEPLESEELDEGSELEDADELGDSEEEEDSKEKDMSTGSISEKDLLLFLKTGGGFSDFLSDL